jgi:hypothetical protein
MKVSWTGIVKSGVKYHNSLLLPRRSETLVSIYIPHASIGNTLITNMSKIVATHLYIMMSIKTNLS